MATYVTLFKFTDQGLKNIKESVKRVEATKRDVEAAGGKLKEVLWLQGEYDLLAIAEWDDEASAMAMNLNVAKRGNAIPRTARAFTVAEMEKILTKVA